MCNLSEVPDAAKDYENMDSCDDCTMLEQRLRAASDYYVRLIVHQDQVLRDGDSEGTHTLEDAIRKARHTRNTAARLLLTHPGNPRGFISAQNKNRRVAVGAAPVLVRWLCRVTHCQSTGFSGLRGGGL
jgi:hypothetical protein